MSSRLPLLSREFARCLSSEINLHISLGLTVDESILFQPGELIFEQAETGLEETHPCSLFPLCIVLEEAEGISHSSWSLSLLQSAASTKKANLEEKHLYSHFSFTPTAGRTLQDPYAAYTHLTILGHGSYILFSTVICTQSYCVRYSTFSSASKNLFMLKIFILGLFPVAFSYILESCHIFIIFRFTISLAFVYLIFFFKCGFLSFYSTFYLREAWFQAYFHSPPYSTEATTFASFKMCF